MPLAMRMTMTVNMMIMTADPQRRWCAACVKFYQMSELRDIFEPYTKIQTHYYSRGDGKRSILL